MRELEDKIIMDMLNRIKNCDAAVRHQEVGNYCAFVQTVIARREGDFDD